MIPAVGQRVGPYEILGRLGSGGMGLVFSAWDARLHRDVAIKLLREEFLTPEMRERFLQEARAASGLNHPHICTIFDIGEQDGAPFLVMELLKGETLRSRVAAGPMTADEIVCVGRETASALAAAHARNIIHRDIKPANLFLVALPGGKTQTKVLDFGLAKVETGDNPVMRYDLTGTGATLGTVAYMSPEQARGEPLDARSDLFSLGVVLYELATGQAPFRGATSALVFVQLLSHPPEPVRELNRTVPRDVEKIIHRLLSKDRADRFQSADELLEALDRASARLSGGKSNSAFDWGSLFGGRNGHGDGPQPLPTRVAGPPPAVLPAAASPKAPLAPLPPEAAHNRESVLRPVKRVSPSDLDLYPVPRSPLPLPSALAQAPVVAAVAPAEVAAPVPPAAVAAAEVPVPAVTHVRPVKPPPQPSGMPPRPVTATPPVAATLPAEADAALLGATANAGNSTRRLSARGAWPWVALGVFAVLLVGSVAWRVVAAGRATPGTTARSRLLLAAVTNRTADETLNVVLLSALRLDMDQSSRLDVVGGDEVAWAMRKATLTGNVPTTMDDAQRIAQAIGATEFAFGELRNDGDGYMFSARVYNTQTGARVATAESHAGSRVDLTDAVDRVAGGLREGLGEGADAVNASSVPLRQNATANIDALKQWREAQAFVDAGRLTDAIAELQRTLAAEPHFPQAGMLLAHVLLRMHAPAAAAAAADAAREASAGASERTVALADATVALMGTHDDARAEQLLIGLNERYGVRARILADLALAQRRQGKFAEALESARKALNLNGRDAEAGEQEELALLSQGRVEAAAAAAAAGERNGRTPEGAAALTNLLLHGPLPEVNAADSSDSLPAQLSRAQALDASGRLQAGGLVWRQMTDEARAVPSLASAGGVALAAQALDHALLDDCAPALVAARQASALPHSERSVFAAGMAQGLCNDAPGARAAAAELDRSFSASFAVRAYEAAELRAVLAFKAGDTTGALSALDNARSADALSIGDALRGMVERATGNGQEAIASYSAVLQRRGATVVACPAVYPMALLGLARAYATTGDASNSRAQYAALLALWNGGDTDSAVFREARAHARP